MFGILAIIGVFEWTYKWMQFVRADRKYTITLLNGKNKRCQQRIATFCTSSDASSIFISGSYPRKKITINDINFWHGVGGHLAIIWKQDACKPYKCSMWSILYLQSDWRGKHFNARCKRGPFVFLVHFSYGGADGTIRMLIFTFA